LSQQDPATAPPQYSPDGRWWWDGARWVPTQQPAARRSGRTVVLVLALVAAAVVGVVLLLAWVGTENYEMRVAEDGSWIDRRVLALLRGDAEDA
jgi:hypothetical protein